MKVAKPLAEVNFPELERKTLSIWDEKNIFRRSIEERSFDNRYNFFDGPPFATGLPHYGHLLAGSIKDAFPRFFTMKGYRVDRRFGWDCHGLPIEMLVQKELGLSGKADIEDYGIDKFNQACRDSVLRYTKEWRDYVRRSGRWVDMDDEYRTMDPDYMECVWAVFQKLWDKGLVYQGLKVLSYSPVLGSTLSNSEASLNYQDVQDPSITVAIDLHGAHKGKRILVWTTTPWTLLANVALAVDPKGLYAEVLVQKTQEKFYILTSRIDSYWKEKQGIEVLRTFLGEELIGCHYEPLFPYFADQKNQNCHRIYGVDFVLDDTGTGTVHMAPAFGEDDFQTGKKYDLPAVDHLDVNGRFLEGSLPEITGMFFKDGDKIIIQALKAAGNLVKHETIVHAYPFCYRSHKPLIYRAMPSWFVNITAMKQTLLKQSRDINWVPDHLKEGRFGKWLENARDWNIARERYWGTPIPIWCNHEGEHKVIGSIAELQKYSEKPITDLHIDHISHVTIPSPTGKSPLKRVPYVFDCWFESGAMPYAQLHYPFDHQKEFHQRFPADFICEGIDQTRCWFYYLHVLGVGFTDKSAFKNVVVNGTVLAEDGRKMSKSLKNYPDPMETIDNYGADAMRLSMLNSPASAGEEMRFSIEAVKEVTRRILLPLWNAYSFFSTYGALINFDPEKDTGRPSEEMDTWILLKKDEMVRLVDLEMQAYRLPRVAPAILAFLDDLNNWYIRRNRRRFWEGDKQAFVTLHQVLVATTQSLAPLAPFLSDYIYRQLALTKELQQTESVHLSRFPSANSFSETDNRLLDRVDIIRKTVELGRSIRKTHKIKNRQPLSKLVVGVVGQEHAQAIESMGDVIKDELNIKDVSVHLDPTQLAEIHVKPNFKVCGKIFGKRMKEVQGLLNGLSPDQAKQAFEGQSLKLADDIEVDASMLIVELKGRQDKLVAAHSHLVVEIDPQISEELKQEGMAREIVSLVQKARKSAGLEVEDRILLSLSSQSKKLDDILAKFRDYIETETLAKIHKQKIENIMFQSQLNVEDIDIELELKKST